MTNEEWAELDYYDDLKEQWQKLMPRLSLWQLVEIFNDKPLLKEIIKHNELEIMQLRDQKQEVQKRFPHFKDRQWLEYLWAQIDKEIDGHLKKIRVCKQAISPAKNNYVSVEERIRQAKEVPLVDFYPEPLRKSGRLLIGKCPLHVEKTGSFTVYPNNTWHCFGCSEGGDVIDFIQKLNGCDIFAALDTLIGKQK